MSQKTHPKKSLHGIFAKNSQFQPLFGMLKQQDRLLDKVKSLLPEPLSSHICHVRSKREQLIVHTDSPVWVAKLHFYAPQLLAELRKEAPMIKVFRARVFVPERTKKALKPKPKDTRRKMTATASASIASAAATISDPALKDVLLRLSQAGKKQT